MTTTHESRSRTERTLLYIIIGVIVVGLIILGLFTFSTAKSNQAADHKADQLIAELQQAGARVPSHDQVVRVLGDHGGAVCANPNQALSRATLFSMLTNGAGGPGLRPVIADSRLLQGELLIIKVYCPDKLPDYQQLVSDLKSADVAGK